MGELESQPYKMTFQDKVIKRIMEMRIGEECDISKMDLPREMKYRALEIVKDWVRNDTDMIPFEIVIRNDYRAFKKKLKDNTLRGQFNYYNNLRK